MKLLSVPINLCLFLLVTAALRYVYWHHGEQVSQFIDLSNSGNLAQKISAHQMLIFHTVDDVFLSLEKSIGIESAFTMSILIALYIGLWAIHKVNSKLVQTLGKEQVEQMKDFKTYLKRCAKIY